MVILLRGGVHLSLDSFSVEADRKQWEREGSMTCNEGQRPEPNWRHGGMRCSHSATKALRSWSNLMFLHVRQTFPRCLGWTWFKTFCLRWGVQDKLYLLFPFCAALINTLFSQNSFSSVLSLFRLVIFVGPSLHLLFRLGRLYWVSGQGFGLIIAVICGEESLFLKQRDFNFEVLLEN